MRKAFIAVFMVLMTASALMAETKIAAVRFDSKPGWYKIYQGEVNGDLKLIDSVKVEVRLADWGNPDSLVKAGYQKLLANKYTITVLGMREHYGVRWSWGFPPKATGYDDFLIIFARQFKIINVQAVPEARYFPIFVFMFACFFWGVTVILLVHFMRTGSLYMLQASVVCSAAATLVYTCFFSPNAIAIPMMFSFGAMLAGAVLPKPSPPGKPIYRKLFYIMIVSSLIWIAASWLLIFLM